MQKKIVDFYNYVEATNAHPASIMLLAMNGDEIAGIGTIHSGNKMKARHQGEWNHHIEGRLKNTTLLDGVYYDLYVDYTTGNTTYKTSLTYTFVKQKGTWLLADFIIN